MTGRTVNAIPALRASLSLGLAVFAALVLAGTAAPSRTRIATPRAARPCHPPRAERGRVHRLIPGTRRFVPEACDPPDGSWCWLPRRVAAIRRSLLRSHPGPRPRARPSTRQFRRPQRPSLVLPDERGPKGVRGPAASGCGRSCRVESGREMKSMRSSTSSSTPRPLRPGRRNSSPTKSATEPGSSARDAAQDGRSRSLRTTKTASLGERRRAPSPFRSSASAARSHLQPVDGLAGAESGFIRGSTRAS